MAKRSKRRSKTTSNTRLSHIPTKASPRLRFTLKRPSFQKISQKAFEPMQFTVEDRPRSSKITYKRVAKPTPIKNKPVQILAPTSLKPQDKKRLGVCIRRAQRKQIIHAVKRAGIRGQKKPDLTEAKIKC